MGIKSYNLAILKRLKGLLQAIGEESPDHKKHRTQKDKVSSDRGAMLQRREIWNEHPSGGNLKMRR